MLTGPERQWRAALGLLLPLGVAAAPAYLAQVNLPLCAFKHLTGLPCPLCGGIRACAALAHGDVAAAWQANPGLLPLLALAAVHTSVLAAEAITGRPLAPAPALASAWRGAGALLLASWLWRLLGAG